MPRGKDCCSLSHPYSPRRKDDIFVYRSMFRTSFFSFLLRHHWDIRAINLIVLSRSPRLTFSEIVYGTLCNIVTVSLSATKYNMCYCGLSCVICKKINEKKKRFYNDHYIDVSVNVFVCVCLCLDITNARRKISG